MTAGLLQAMPAKRSQNARSVLEISDSIGEALGDRSPIAEMTFAVPKTSKSLTANVRLGRRARHLSVDRWNLERVGLAEKLFDARVGLKMATAQYAMYLPKEARDRLFAEFDFVLEEDSWDESDRLPSVESYLRFLKWMVFTKDLSWSSMGIDPEGNLLVAWVKGLDVMTANFGEKIRWSQRFCADGETQQTAGSYSLEYFAKKCREFLGP